MIRSMLPIRSLAATVLFLMAGCAGAVPPSTAPTAPEADPALPVQDAAYRTSYDPLDGFFRQMAALRAGRQQHVRIVQLGDSHTAADFFSGELRDHLQAEFGNGGIGFRAAGIPYEGIRKKDMQLAQAGHWQYHNSLTDHAFTDYGISGFTAVSNSVGASLTLTATDPRGFDGAYVDFVRRPGPGAVELYLDDRPVRSFPVAGAAGTLGRAHVDAPAGGAHSLRLVADRRGIEILAWGTERNERGVVLDSFGVVGATAGIIDNWQEGLAHEELASLHPALVILAYGTNEGVRTNFDPDAYRTDFNGILDKMHRWAGPAASVLVSGPTDGSRQAHGCSASDNSGGCAWRPLPALDAVRHLQVAAAASHQAGFWNGAETQMRSGGINAWAAMQPPLARADHIHFTPAGYAILGGDLYRWLTEGFEQYARAHHVAAAPL